MLSLTISSWNRSSPEIDDATINVRRPLFHLLDRKLQDLRANAQSRKPGLKNVHVAVTQVAIHAFSREIKMRFKLSNGRVNDGIVHVVLNHRDEVRLLLAVFEGWHKQSRVYTMSFIASIAFLFQHFPTKRLKWLGEFVPINLMAYRAELATNSL